MLWTMKVIMTFFPWRPYLVPPYINPLKFSGVIYGGYQIWPPGEKCHNYFHSSQHSWQHSCWSLSPSTPSREVWVGRKTERKGWSPLWSIVLANPTFPKTPLISVCLICAFQKIFYVKKGNYLEFVWRCRFWRPTRPWRENHDFPILNFAKLAIPLFLPDSGTLEISVMTRYLDDHEQCRPKMLGVYAHLCKLLSPQI